MTVRKLTKVFLYLLLFLTALILALVVAFIVYVICISPLFLISNNSIEELLTVFLAPFLAILTFIMVIFWGSYWLLKFFDHRLVIEPKKRREVAGVFTAVTPFFFLCAGCSVFMIPTSGPEDYSTPPPPDSISSLTSDEQACLATVINLGDSAYLKRQASGGNIAVGFVENDTFSAAIFSVDDNGNCVNEFQEKIWSCHDSWSEELCEQNLSEFEPQKIQVVEVTGKAPPEIYLWMTLPGINQKLNEYHAFYSKQEDNSYQEIYTRNLCRKPYGFIKIDESTQLIEITDDVVCKSFPGHKTKAVISLEDGSPKTISYTQYYDSP